MATTNKRSLMMDKAAMLALGDRYFPVRTPRPQPYLLDRLAFFDRMKATAFPKKEAVS